MASSLSELRGAWLSQFGSANTRDAYRRDLDSFLSWLDEDPFPGDRARIQAWLGHLTDLGRSSATVSRKASAVASFYQYALEEGHIDKNPAELVRRPRREEGQKMGLSLEQARDLVAAAAVEGPTHHALVWLLAGCALRVTEACSLDLEDLHNLDTQRPTLRVKTKGGRISEKPIPKQAVRALLDARGDRLKGPLLTNRDGNRLDRRRAWELVERLTRKAGIENCTPHILRHTAASLALAAGVPIQDVQKLLGHKSIETTLRYVRNLDTFEAAQNAADVLAEKLS